MGALAGTNVMMMTIAWAATIWIGR